MLLVVTVKNVCPSQSYWKVSTTSAAVKIVEYYQILLGYIDWSYNALTRKVPAITAMNKICVSLSIAIFSIQ